MIIRVVKLQFKQEVLEEALSELRSIAPKVRSMEGCRFLEIGVRSRDKGLVITYSYWDGVDYLNAYRSSDIFKEFWSSIKPLFDAKAEAWSLDRVVRLD